MLYTKGARSAQDEVSVTILPPDTPQLMVYSSHRRISRALPIAFVAEVFGTFTETLSYSWKCFDKQGKGSLIYNEQQRMFYGFS